jgi:hypothetical protein
MAAGGGDILRIVEEVQTREIKKEIAIVGKKDNFIEVEDERHALWSKPTVSIQAGYRGCCWTLIRDSWRGDVQGLLFSIRHFREVKPLDQ